MTQLNYTPVRDVMSVQVRTIDGLATVSEAITEMRENAVSSLVIERRHDGDEFGIVAVDDIANKVIGPNLSADRINVYEIMSKPVLTVDGGMDIKYAVRLLGRFGLTRALVTEGGRLIGIVTLRDMVLRYIPPADSETVET